MITIQMWGTTDKKIIAKYVIITLFFFQSPKTCVLTGNSKQNLQIDKIFFQIKSDQQSRQRHLLSSIKCV